MKTLRVIVQFSIALVALACAAVFCLALLVGGLLRLGWEWLRNGVTWLCKI